jgi:hypothetical protein
MAAIECKLAMVINRLVEFELLMELTGFLLWRRYWRQYWGTFFSGAFLPQKWDDLSPFLSTIQAPQEHVLSY